MSRSIRVFAEGVLKNVSGVRVRVGGAWKTVSSVRVRVGGAWKDVFPPPVPLPPPAPPAPPSPPTPPPPPFSVACDPIQVSGRDRTGGTVVTGAATAIITGGTAPYIVAWEVASWSTNTTTTPTVISPTISVTAFSCVDVPNNDIVTATFRVNVQDSSSPPNAAVAQVDAIFRRITTE